MNYPQQKQVCQLDDNGIFIGIAIADLSPLEAEQGIYLLPANSIDVAPPKSIEGQAAKWVDDNWVYVADHRGQTIYSITDKHEQEVDSLGDIPEGYTSLKPQTPLDDWDGDKWVTSEEVKAQLKAEQQEQAWELIKQKRYENGLGGVYIERVGKWFQTGEEEKTKYLGLDKVIDKLKEIDWKCADNTFTKMNRTLLDEIFLQMVVTENADHINAEKHRMAMMAVENPLEYDYSSGWAEIYTEGK